MQPENRPRFYHPELDGLRFIAFLLVFIHNSPIFTQNKLVSIIHEYGWIGVDLFFCLSGFLITKLLITEREQTGDINIRDFYVRRILRIGPLYFLYLLIAVFYITRTTGLNHILLLHTVGLVTFTYDVVYLFLTHRAFAVFFHLWTISYESQYYAIVPWVLRMFNHKTKKMIGRYLLVTFLLGNFIRAILIRSEVPHPAIYMLPFTHFEALLGGFAIGLGIFDALLMNCRVWMLFLLGTTCTVILFLLPNTYEIGWSLMFTYPLAGAGATLVILSLIKETDTVFAKLLRSRPLTLLGKISYGLYIYHLLSLSLADKFIQNALGIYAKGRGYDPLILLIGLGLTVVLSVLSFRFWERKFLQLKNRFSFLISRPL